MKVQLLQKVVSDQENYNLIAEFNSEDDAVAYVKAQQLQGLFRTVIPLHSLTATSQTVTAVEVVSTPCA